MADYYGATLYVPKKAITAEIQKMFGDYVNDYPDCEINEGNGLFTLYSPEARWGEFEAIETALVEAEIPFDRETTADYGNPSFTTHFRPGITPKPKEVFDEVAVQAIRNIVNAYSSDETRGQLYGALTYYLEVNFPTFPVLEDMVKPDLCEYCGEHEAAEVWEGKNVCSHCVNDFELSDGAHKAFVKVVRGGQEKEASNA